MTTEYQKDCRRAERKAATRIGELQLAEVEAQARFGDAMRDWYFSEYMRLVPVLDRVLNLRQGYR